MSDLPIKNLRQKFPFSVYIYIYNMKIHKSDGNVNLGHTIVISFYFRTNNAFSSWSDDKHLNNLVKFVVHFKHMDNAVITAKEIDELNVLAHIYQKDVLS